MAKNSQKIPPMQVSEIFHRLTSRSRSLMGIQEYGAEDPDKIGLSPETGWQRRNLQFVGNILIPSLFTRRTGTPASAPEAPRTCGQATITWIGHASFLVQLDGLNIMIDPNWALWHGIVKRMRKPGIRIDDLPPIDLVLVTHAHFDHLHRPSLKRIAAGQPIITPRGVGSLVSGLGFGEVVELAPWDNHFINDVLIQLTPARHWGARFIHDTHRGFGGFLMKGASTTVYHAGDSSYFEGFKEIGERAGGIDMALLPIGAYEAPSGREVHMNPEEALDAMIDLKAHRMVPMHYGTFPLGAEPIAEPAQRLHHGAARRGLHKQVDFLQEGCPRIV